jgi:hypothetical protein
LTLNHFPADDAGNPIPRPAEDTSRRARWELASQKRVAGLRSKSGQVGHEKSRLVLTLIKRPPLGVREWKTARSNSISGGLEIVGKVHGAEDQNAIADLLQEIPRNPYSAHGGLTHPGEEMKHLVRVIIAWLDR